MSAFNFLFTIQINKYELATILWNLFLTIIPFGICFILVKLKSKNNYNSIIKIVLGSFLGVLWLIFIPNTAYIITDIRHIMDYCPRNYDRVCLENSWMIVFFFFYGLIGWLTFVYALNQMKNAISKFKTGNLGKIFIIAVIPIIAIGVMLGLINRANSWEIFLQPVKITEDALYYFSQLKYFKNWVIFTIFFYLLYFLGTIILIKFDNRKKFN